MIRAGSLVRVRWRGADPGPTSLVLHVQPEEPAAAECCGGVSCSARVRLLAEGTVRDAVLAWSDVVEVLA